MMACTIKAQIFFQSSNNNSILEQLEEIKEKEKNDYVFKFTKSSKTSEEVCKTTTIQGQYPSNTTVITGDSVINGIREKRLSRENGLVEMHKFLGVTIKTCSITFYQYLREIFVISFSMFEQIMLNFVLQDKFKINC